MANKKIKDALERSGLMKWELADLMNISPNYLSVKLRHELPEDEQQGILKMINAEAERRKETGGNDVTAAG